MKNLILLVGLTGILFSCNSQKVSVDYDRNFDFNQVKSYTLETNTSLSDLDQARLVAAIEQNLKFRGVQRVDNSNVHIKISPREYVTSRTNSSLGIGMGTGGRGFGGGLSVGVPLTTSKTLNLDYTVSMYDNSTMIWEGILNIQMPMNASADVKQQSIDKGVYKLFKNYPPKK
jgi:hypothetical protein